MMIRVGPRLKANEIPQAANRVVGAVGRGGGATDRVVGAELFLMGYCSRESMGEKLSGEFDRRSLELCSNESANETGAKRMANYKQTAGNGIATATGSTRTFKAIIKDRPQHPTTAAAN